MTAPPAFPSWCEVYPEVLAENLRLTQARLSEGRQLCAVLKADAYGHGIANVVPVLRAGGVDRIGITSNDEARAVRDAGFTGRLMRLRAATPEEIVAADALRVEEQVSSLAVAECLAARAASGAPVRAHLALNALGMSRDGLELETASGRDLATQILRRIGDRIVAVCTHFPVNQPDGLRRGAKVFRDHADWAMRTGGLDRERCERHAGSSLTVLSGEEVGSDMYRCGALLYGILAPEQGFRSTMALKARIVSVGDYPAGARVGYDSTVTLDGPRRLACLSIGYANGVRRASENAGAVAIAGGLAPVIGRISMNAMVVDVTHIAGARIGSAATLFGGALASRGANAQAEAQFSTIIADLMADWGARNPRLLVPGRRDEAP